MSASSITEYTDNLSEDGKKYVGDFIGFMRKQYPQIDSKICIFNADVAGGGKNEGRIYRCLCGQKSFFYPFFRGRLCQQYS